MYTYVPKTRLTAVKLKNLCARGGVYIRAEPFPALTSIKPGVVSRISHPSVRDVGSRIIRAPGEARARVITMFTHYGRSEYITETGNYNNRSVRLCRAAISLSASDISSRSPLVQFRRSGPFSGPALILRPRARALAPSARESRSPGYSLSSPGVSW